MSDIRLDIPDISVIVNTGDNYNVNLHRSQTVAINKDNYFRVADLATSASYAVTASYVAGDAGVADWSEITNKPTVVSSSTQIQLGQISGTTFGSANFTFPQSLFVEGPLSASSITGSFKGDGSQLTGLVTDLRISGSSGADVVSLLTDDLTVTGINGLVATVTDNTITIDVPVALTSSLFGTASIAENITLIDAGTYTTGSDSVIIPTPSGGLSYTTSASHALFADSASIHGTIGYIPRWNTSTSLTQSILYQTASGILINSTTQHTPESPDVLGVYAGVTDSYNAVSVHGTIDNYLQINIKNFDGGTTASSDIVATADTGNESAGYINMGINGSGYTGSFIGGALDAYLYSTGSELLIGNISEGYGITFFTSGPNVDNTGRMFITPDGTVGINTRETTTGFPETLFVRALNDNTYNLITAKSKIDAYSQFNLQNEGTGSYSSADIVATADNGNERGNFINIGINGSQYIGDFTGDYGNANDAYLYSTGSSGHLHIGEASPTGEVTIFAGGTDFETTSKLRIRANNQHELSGSLFISGSLTVSGSSTFTNIGPAVLSGSLNVTNGITGSLNYNNIVEVPDGLVSSSNQITEALPAGLISSSEQINTGSFSGSFIGTLTGTIESASYATTASYALVAVAEVPQGTVSSSTQIDYTQIQNQPTTIATASYVTYANVADKPALVSASSQISYTGLTDIPSNIISNSAQLPVGIVSSSTQILNYNTFATTASNVFDADQIITGSLYITNNLHVFGSSSVSYISQSTLDIGTNIITVNVQNPSVRYGGLAVIDSASSPRVSGSLLFDSVENQWLFIHQDQANITSSILLMGPETYNNVGNETHPTTNRVMKSINDEHLGDSQITDDGTTVSIPGNLTVSGVVSASQFTGSLFGTATTASYALPAGLPSGVVSSSNQISQFGNIRLQVGTTGKNSGASFYLNSNTRTATDSTSPQQDTAFLIQSAGLTTVNVYLMQGNAIASGSSNSTLVGVARNANGMDFSEATLIASSSANLLQHSIQTWTFSGLSLAQFDSIHIYVDPTSAPGTLFGVVVVS